MRATENSFEVFPPSTEIEHQDLVITAAFDYKETVSPQRSLSDLSQSTTPCTEVRNFLHSSNAFPSNDRSSRSL